MSALRLFSTSSHTFETFRGAGRLQTRLSARVTATAENAVRRRAGRGPFFAAALSAAAAIPSPRENGRVECRAGARAPLTSAPSLLLRAANFGAQALAHAHASACKIHTSHIHLPECDKGRRSLAAYRVAIVEGAHRYARQKLLVDGLRRLRDVQSTLNSSDAAPRLWLSAVRRPEDWFYSAIGHWYAPCISQPTPQPFNLTAYPHPFLRCSYSGHAPQAQSHSVACKPYRRTSPWIATLIRLHSSGPSLCPAPLSCSLAHSSATTFPWGRCGAPSSLALPRRATISGVAIFRPERSGASLRSARGCCAPFLSSASSHGAEPQRDTPPVLDGCHSSQRCRI